MRIQNTLAPAAVVVAALLSTAHAQWPAGDLPEPKAFFKSLGTFMLYEKLCNVPTIITPTTKIVMGNLLALLSDDDRHQIALNTKAEVKEEIEAAGLQKFCTIYGPGMTPLIRKLNDESAHLVERSR